MSSILCFKDADGIDYNVAIDHIVQWQYTNGITIIVTDYNLNFSVVGDFTSELHKVKACPEKGNVYRLGEGWFDV